MESMGEQKKIDYIIYMANSNMDRDTKWSMMDKGYLPLD
jgi:hypothetical protein